MIIYAACYTDCFHEYGPSIFSLHLSKEGAEVAIGESKAISKAQNDESDAYMKEQDFDWYSPRVWNPINGSGHEEWEIREMEVFP